MSATLLLAALLAQSAPQPQQPPQPAPAPAAEQEPKQPLERLPPRQPRADDPAATGSLAQDRAWIGVTLQSEARDGDDPARSGGGLTVVQVLPGSPAAKAGLEDGDRILAVEGKPLGSYDALASLLREHVPGNRLRLEVRREVSITPERGDAGRPRLGVVLEPAGGRGAQVSEVVASSPAARAGLRGRDRLLAIGGAEVAAPEDVIRALEEHSSNRAIAVAFARELEVTLGRMPEGLSSRPQEGAFGLPGLTPLPEPGWPYPAPVEPHASRLEGLESELRSLAEEVRSLRAMIEELRAEIARLRR